MSDQPGKPEQPASPSDPRRLARAQAAVDAMKRPQRIGPYRILETLGEGGMGVVYLAEQEKPLHRRVALKIIKLGMDTKNVIARFEAEREALALMNHPNVARVFDAGSTEEGRPFFVMEYVPGLPITEYCDRHRVSTEDRLRLFMDVCHAVQHAHQKGIIHRDIKPSNVLVTVQDDKPVPKVIDFGVAKATQQRLTELTVFTEQGQLIGTPGYMSPEQADFTAMDIDTRTDVYSLGVLLYELLVGALPFDTRFLLAAGWLELQRIIREVDPPRPSTRLSAMRSEPRASARAMVQSSNAPIESEPSRRLKPAAQDQYRDREEADSSSTQSLQPAPPNLQSPISNPQSQDPITAVAHRRRTQPATLLRILRGDLDWVVMKCLEKDRTRRYDTANALAMDVQRFLSSEPVLAGPPGLGYRVRKFVRRNKAGVLVGAFILTGVLTASWVLTASLARESKARRAAEIALQSEAAQRTLAEQALTEAKEARALAERAQSETTAERDRAVAAEKSADARRAESEAVTSFLTEMFSSIDPEKAQGREITVREILEEAAINLDERFAESPSVAGKIHLSIGDTYRALGRYSDAEEQFHATVNAYLLASDAPPHYLTEAFEQLGKTKKDLGKWKEAKLLFSEARDRLRSQRVRDPASAGEGLLRIGELLQELQFQQPFLIDEEILRIADESFAEGLSLLGHAYPEESELFARAALRVAENLRNRFPNGTSREFFDEVEQLTLSAIATYEHIYGKTHLLTNKAKRSYQSLLSYSPDISKRREAAQIDRNLAFAENRTSMEPFRMVYSHDLATWDGLDRLRRRRGYLEFDLKGAQNVDFLRLGFKELRQHFGDDNLNRAQFLSDLMERQPFNSNRSQDLHYELVKEAIAAHRSVYGSRHPRVAEIAINGIHHLSGFGRSFGPNQPVESNAAESETLAILEDALSIYLEAYSSQHFRTRWALEMLINLLRQAGCHERAQQLCRDFFPEELRDGMSMCLECEHFVRLDGGVVPRLEQLEARYVCEYPESARIMKGIMNNGSVTGMLIRALMDNKRYSDAIRVLNESLDTVENVWEIKDITSDLADCNLLSERYREAEKLYQETWYEDRAAIGLARARLAMNDPLGALRPLQVMFMMERANDHNNTLATPLGSSGDLAMFVLMGECYAKLKQFPRADRTLLFAYDRGRQYGWNEGRSSGTFQADWHSQTLMQLIALYEGWGKPELAEPFRKEYEQVLEKRRQAPYPVGLHEQVP